MSALDSISLAMGFRAEPTPRDRETVLWPKFPLGEKYIRAKAQIENLLQKQRDKNENKHVPVVTINRLLDPSSDDLHEVLIQGMCKAKPFLLLF